MPLRLLIILKDDCFQFYNRPLLEGVSPLVQRVNRFWDPESDNGNGGGSDNDNDEEENEEQDDHVNDEDIKSEEDEGGDMDELSTVFSDIDE